MQSRHARNARIPEGHTSQDDTQSDRDTDNDKVIIRRQNMVSDDGPEPLGPDQTGFTHSFLKDKAIPQISCIYLSLSFVCLIIWLV